MEIFSDLKITWIARFNQIIAMYTLQNFILIILGMIFGTHSAISQTSYEYFKSGNEHFTQQRYTEAKADYEAALRIDPQFAKAYHNLGNILYLMQDYPGAEKNFSQAIRLSPSDAEPYNSRAALYFGLRKYKEAISDVDKAIALNPGFSAAHELRASIYSALGKKEEACESWNQAAKLGNPVAPKENWPNIVMLPAKPPDPCFTGVPPQITPQKPNLLRLPNM
ncbi:MAG: tetratricopeptide repeat protein [Bacteroidia bacterium]|nr:tetratricopeptide repeat protein [Bacteroidia bacterium]